jgi:classical protein kinase C
MSSVSDTVASVQKKIDREKALINAANAMRQSTNNPAVLSRLDGQIKDGRRNIEYFESKLRDLDVQRTTSGMDSMSLQPGASGSRKANNPLTPPPKDNWNGGYVQDQSGYGPPQGRGANVTGGDGLMPPRAPYAPSAPGAPNKRPNYSKLGM